MAVSPGLRTQASDRLLLANQMVPCSKDETDSGKGLGHWYRAFPHLMFHIFSCHLMFSQCFLYSLSFPSLLFCAECLRFPFRLSGRAFHGFIAVLSLLFPFFALNSALLCTRVFTTPHFPLSLYLRTFFPYFRFLPCFLYSSHVPTFILIVGLYVYSTKVSLHASGPNNALRYRFSSARESYRRKWSDVRVRDGMC